MTSQNSVEGQALALGVISAFLVYSLLFNFLSPVYLNFFASLASHYSPFNGYEKIFVNNALGQSNKQNLLLREIFFTWETCFSLNFYLYISVQPSEETFKAIK